MKAKRLIATLLCAMMLVSLLPAAVFAEEAGDEEIVEISFDAEEAEEILPEEPAQEETAEEPAEEDEAVEDEELPADEEIAEEPETEDAENEFEAVIAAGICGTDAIWSLSDNGELVISGTGAMDNFADTNPGWEKYSVTAVKIRSGITAVGDYAFYAMDGIVSAELPATLVSIGQRAFTMCDKLKEITVPSKVTSVGERAFAECYALSKITFTGNAPAIAADAFDYVEAEAFYPSGNSTWNSNKLNYGGTLNWTSDTAIYGACGENCTWKLDNGVLTISGKGEMEDLEAIPWKEYRDSITQIVVTEGVTSISERIFSNSTNLSYVSLPNTLKIIGYGAFWDCPKLESIIIPNSVTTIKNSVFWNCGLKSITIPASVTELGGELFLGCTQLSAINIVGTASGFKSINGVVFSADGRTLVTYPAGKQDKSCSIPTGVTAIEEYAFDGNEFLESVVIPDTVTSIGVSAFRDNISLKNVVLPKNITEISSGLFQFCESLASVNIPESVTSIGNSAFQGAGITDLKLSDNLKSIDNYAFRWCENLTNVTIPASVTNIGWVAFGWCDTPKTLKFLGDAPNINSHAFDFCKITAYYPAGNKTWTSDVMQQYGGTVTWIPYGGGTSPVITTVANHADYMIVSWGKVEGAVSYTLAYREGSGAWQSVAVSLLMVDSKGNPRVNLKNLKQGVNYTFIAYANFADGTQTKSASATQTRLLTPTVNAKANNGYVALTWNNVEGGSQYKIYYREKGGSWQLYAYVGKSVTSVNIKESVINANGWQSLTKGKTYEFAVLTATSVPGITSGFPTTPTAIVY